MFAKTHIKLLVVIVFVVLYSQNSFSQSEPSSGRMADGRAYRTDSQGVVMIDYIAELELETDSLRRQVQGLESEIEELRSSGSNNKKVEAPVVQQIECPVTTCPEKICPAPKVCPVVEPVVRKDVNDCQQEAKLISDLESQIQKFTAKEQELTDRLNLVSVQLNASKLREDKVLAENQNLRKQTTTLASLNVNKLPEVVANSNPNLQPKLPSKNLVNSRNEFLIKVKSDLNSKVDVLQSAISKRNSKYQSFKTNYTGVVSFTPSKIEYDNGQQVLEARASIQSETSMRRLSEYAKQTNSLIEKVNFEIGMMDRLLSMKNPAR